jgi:hypothetical protein
MSNRLYRAAVFVAAVMAGVAVCAAPAAAAPVHALPAHALPAHALPAHAPPVPAMPIKVPGARGPGMTGQQLAVTPDRVTLTGVRDGMVESRLTASPRRFAAALRAESSTDAAPAAVTPHTKLYTVKFKVTSLPGHPGSFASLQLVNTDNANLFDEGFPVQNGVVTTQVPAGDYGASILFVDATSKGYTSAHLVTIGNFKVTGTSKVTTITVNEKTANVPISVSTPHPATEDTMGVDVYQMDGTGKNGGSNEFTDSGVPEFRIYVNAQTAPKVGSIHYVAYWGGAGTSASSPYRYDLAFGSDDIPANEHFTATSSDLATVHQELSSDPAAGSKPGYLELTPVDRWALITGYGDSYPDSGGKATMPGELTDYLGTGDGGGWQQLTQIKNLGIIQDDPLTFQAGHQYTLNWAHGPLAPALGQNTGPSHCDACTAGSTMSLSFATFGDSTPSHYGFYLPKGGTYQLTLSRGSTTLAKNDYLGATVTGIPDTPAVYHVVATDNVSKIHGVSQSSQTDTVLNIPYTPKPTPGSALPAGDRCTGQTASTPCEILPALTLNYQLASNDYNTSSATTQQMGLTVGHVSYNGAGSHAAIKTAAVWVSFNDGKTWQQATLTGTNGHYTVRWANPASAKGTDPDLRVTATDALGGSITQTITNAYTIAK